jgi:glycosyltransferase involved in cell wall biosynthesis
MRILYDGEIFRFQSFGGISRYFQNLIRNLPAKFEPSLLVTPESDVSQVKHPNLTVSRYGIERLQSFSHRLNKYLAKVERDSWDRMMWIRRFNLAHPTYYWLVTQRQVSDYRCPVVITVWDMIYELFPSPYLDPTGERTELKRKAIMAADTLLCISENTKQDLMRLYSIPESRITVTYLAANLNDSMAHGPEPVPARPYYLYVGGRAPHKNFDLLLEALAKAVSVEPDLYLCVAGPSPLNDEEKKKIVGLKLEDRVGEVGAVADEHLAKLYRCSIALVYPSLYEGFGIPPLEAMACGTTVVTSRSSSIPEVVGDAGIYFDPRAADELADILVDLRRNASLRDEMVSKGFTRAGLFSWQKTATETARVYRALVR